MIEGLLIARASAASALLSPAAYEARRRGLLKPAERMLPREWLEKAEFFRREAKRHLEEGVYWAACFEAQQAAELYLKALQVALTGSHDFTHDLSKLLEGLEALGLRPPRGLYAAADALTPHYTMARYPGRKPVVYDRRTAERCIGYMEAIVEWVVREARRRQGEDAEVAGEGVEGG